MNAFLVFNEIFFNKKLVKLPRTLIKNCTFVGVISTHEISSACRVSHEGQTWIRFQNITHRRNVNVEEKIIL